MSAINLEEYLRKNMIWHRVIIKPETVHTADAARVAGIDLSRLTKNLVSETDQGEHVMLIVPGNKKVDLKAAATVLGAREVHLVPFDKAEKISGFPPGGTPSIGHKSKMRMVIDRSLLQHDTIYCGGGSRDKLLELRTRDVIRLSDALVADISKDM